MQRKHMLIIDWNDRGVEDSDEVVVFAQSDEEAERKGRAKWRMTIGAKWPHCRITKIKILRQNQVQKLA